MKFKFIPFLLLFAIASRSIASDLTHPATSRYWANLGMGFSTIGFSADFEFSLQHGKDLFSTRFIGSAEIPLTFSSPRAMQEELAVLYGRNISQNEYDMSVSAGISYIHGVKKGTKLSINTFEEVRYATVGIVLEGQFYNNLSSFLGIGITAFADINIQDSVIGGVLSVRLGSLF